MFLNNISTKKLQIVKTPELLESVFFRNVKEEVLLVNNTKYKIEIYIMIKKIIQTHNWFTQYVKTSFPAKFQILTL